MTYTSYRYDRALNCLVAIDKEKDRQPREVSMQLYGDAEAQELILTSLAATFNTDIVVRRESDYCSKRGKTGHYINARLKLD